MKGLGVQHRILLWGGGAWGGQARLIQGLQAEMKGEELCEADD